MPHRDSDPLQLTIAAPDSSSAQLHLFVIPRGKPDQHALNGFDAYIEQRKLALLVLLQLKVLVRW